MTHPQFEDIAVQVRDIGRRGSSATMFTQFARRTALVCAECGPLPEEEFTQPRFQAMGHVQKTGHQVIEESWSATIYWPR